MVTGHIVNYDPEKRVYWIPKHRHCIVQFEGWTLFTASMSSAFFNVAECFKIDGPPGIKFIDLEAKETLLSIMKLQTEGRPHSDLYLDHLIVCTVYTN